MGKSVHECKTRSRTDKSSDDASYTLRQYPTVLALATNDIARGKRPM
jgi:hypothetical protein